MGSEMCIRDSNSTTQYYRSIDLTESISFFEHKSKHFLYKFDISLMCTQLEDGEMYEQTANFLILHCQLAATLVIDIVAQIPSGISTHLHWKFLLQLIQQPIAIDFTLYTLIQFTFFDDLLVSRLISIVIRYAEIFVVVATFL